MTKKIAFVGGPGSGKSTLAAEAFTAFKKLGKNVEMVSEWIRKDIARNGPMVTVFEQARTLMYHREEESDFPPQVEYVLVDSGCLTPYFYTAIYAEKDHVKHRLPIQDMYRYLLDDLYRKRYEHIFFVPRAFTDAAGATFDDGTRYQTKTETDLLERFMRLIFLEVHRMDNIHELDCPLSERISRVVGTVLGIDAVATLKGLP
jgi:hypothetical protein